MIICIWLISAHTCAPSAFNYWVVLFFDVYMYIFWLCTMAVAAVWAAAILAGSSITSSYYDSYCKNYFDNYDDQDFYNEYCKGNSSLNSYYKGDYKVFGGVVAAIAGLGAIEL